MGKSVEKITFCKMSDNLLKEQREAFVDLVSSPKFVCKKCFRVSKKKQNLCKPEKLKEDKAK